jgi:predicted MPP superfamily phosphohydrolase
VVHPKPLFYRESALSRYSENAIITTQTRLPLFPITRRKFIGLAAAAGAAALAVDSTIFEPNRPRIVRQDIALRRWPDGLDGFTIALLSDFHYDPLYSVHPLKAAIAMVNGLSPDLIALTGDFVTSPWFSANAKGAAAAEPCAELLRQMHAPHGLWAVLGNHDFFTDAKRVTSALRAAGIQVLINQSTAIEANGVRFWLGGVNDLLGGRADLNATLRPISSGEATILMAHEPDYADFVARHPIDLQLSGHTHGGQVRLPLLGPLYLPDLGKKYVSGLYKVGDLTLYTNPGLGTVQIPVRLNCPPEITLLTIRRLTG